MMFKILKALRMIVIGLFKFNHGMSATGTKYWGHYQFLPGHPRKPTLLSLCAEENVGSGDCNTQHLYTG